MPPFPFAGATAVVTGAASGIGEALAHALAARGAHLVLVDRDADRLSTVVTALAERDVTVSSHVADLGDAAAVQTLVATIRADQPRLDLLVNNAGVALTGEFEQVTLAEFDWLMNINFRAMVHLTHGLLPALRVHPGAHIVNVSSLFGLIAPAGQVAYSSSKFAVRGFTESLRHELARTGLSVTSVHPGGIATRIAETARAGSGVDPRTAEVTRRLAGRVLRMDPAKAADIIVRGIERRRGRVLISTGAYVLDALARTMPVRYGSVLAALTARAARARARRTPVAAEPSTLDS